MEEALGPVYHRAWARQFVMAELGGRTAQEALDAGIRAQAGLGSRLARTRAAGDLQVTTAEIAVIGGTGFYSFLEDAEEHAVATPYGDPSAPVAVGTVAGRRVAFLPRHGRHARLPAAR